MDEFKLLRRNIARRIFMALVIALIPSYIVVLAINYITVERVQNMTVDSVTTQASRHLQALSVSVGEIIAFQHEHMANIDFYRMVLAGDIMDNQQKTNIIRDTQARLVMAQSVSGMIRSVDILVPALNCTIGSSSFTSSVDMDEFRKITDYGNFFGRNMLLLGNRLLISLPLPDQVISKTEPLYVTLTEIDHNALINELSSLEAYERSVVILMNASGQILAANTTDAAMINDCENIVQAGESGNSISQVGGERYYISVHHSDALDMYLAVYMPRAGIDRMIGRYYWFFALAVLVAVVTIVLFSSWEYVTLYKPLQMLLDAFANLSIGDPKGSAIKHSPGDPFYYIYNKYNEMNQRLHEMVEVVYEKQIQTQRAELRNLQSQINPHMLSNSFFTLSQMARLNDMNSLTRFSRSLSRYYRALTRTTPMLTLQEEIEYAKLYAEINGILHFSKTHTVFEALPENVCDLNVPKLIVQPLIENAYKHAHLANTESAQVRISFEQGSDWLKISVGDNGKGISPDALATINSALADEELRSEDISGLLNVHKRLRLTYGLPYGLSVSGGEDAGFKATIMLPINRSMPDQ